MTAALEDELKTVALKKRNRIKKLSPKIHQISHESGRSIKDLWAKMSKKKDK